MAKNKTGNFRNLNSKISPLVRDRGLSSTIGLIVSFGVQPALANNSVTTPVAFVPPTAHSHTADPTQTFIQHNHAHLGHTQITPSTNTNTSGSSANNQTSSTSHSHSSDTNGSPSGQTSTSSSSSSSSQTPTSSSSSSSSSGSTTSVSTNSGTPATSSGTSGSNSHTSSSAATYGTQTQTQTPTHTRTHTTATSAASGGTTSGTANLDLTSSAATYTIGTLGNFKTVTIDVGGQLEQVTATTKLTSAELLAADAALHAANSTATQSLIINAQGVATGGDFTLNHSTLRTLDAITGGVGSLTIPSKVTLDDNLKAFNISGNLTNDGSIVASTKSGTGNALEATNISNAAGASITGSGALTLTASQSVVNAGTIKSGGDLTVTATTLTNESNGMTPTISAGHDLVLNVPTINNSGTLHAANDVNFTNASSIVLNQAAQANVVAVNNINFHDTSYTGAGNVTVNGGNLLSQNLNIYAPTGQVSLTASNVTGQLNGNVGAIHTDTTATTLILGNLNITGDPQFYNHGNIEIAGGVQDTNGVPLAIVATGNISSAGGSLVTAGGDLTLIAGTNYSTNDGTVNSISAPNWSSVLTLTGASPTGGYIDLTGVSTSTAAIKAISTAAVTAGNGGDLTMVAYYGSNAGAGTIATPAAVTINVSGIDFNKYNATTNPQPVLSTNGKVTFIAPGYSNGVSMNVLSPIIANGATGGGGQILISNGLPTAVGTTIAGVASPYEIVNGQPYGSFTAGTLGGGSITLGQITGYQPAFQSPERGGSISISTNGTINANGSLYDEGINMQTASNLLQTANWTAGGITITTSGYFAQNANTTTTIDGVSGQYNITAGGAFINLTGTDNVHGGSLGAASLNAVETNDAATIYVGYSAGLGHVNVDNATFSGATNIVINGTLTTISTIDAPSGSGNLTFTNSSGNLGISGPGTIQNYGTFAANASGYINIPVASTPAIDKATNPNGWLFNAGGTLAIPFTSLTTSADPTTGNGGTISLTYGGNGLSYPTVATLPLTLTANGANAGTTQNGGSVSINITNTNAPVIGNTAGEFIIAANSGSLSTAVGGQVSISAVNNMAVDPNFLSNTGTGIGGSLSFTSTAGNIYVRGSLSEAPTGGSPANYGNITFTSPGNKSGFTVGQVTLEGVNGNLTGDVTINNPVGVLVAQGSSIVGNQIVITAPLINNSGTIMGTNIGMLVTSDVSLNVNNFNNLTTGEIGAQVGAMGQSQISISAATGNLAITGAGKFDNTFAYSFTSTNGAVSMGPLFTPGVVASNPVFDQLTISAKTSLTVGADGFTTDGGATGKISISTTQLSYLDPTTKPFTLNADGSNSVLNPQDGIYVNVIGATSNQIIGTAAGQFVLQAESGAIGGTVSFITGGNLIVNETPAALNNSNGNLILSAATNLEVIGAISQGTGAVTLTSTNPTTGQFVVGTTVVSNGVSGNISGGLITLNEQSVVVNNGSSISGTGIVLNTNSVLNNGALTIAGPTTTGLVVTGVPVSGTTPNLTFTNNGTITSPTQISVNSTANITMAGSGTYASTLEYDFNGVAVNLGTLFSTPTSNPFSTLNINATGLITLDTNDLKTQGLATNVINITSAGGTSYLNQSTAPLILDTRSPNGGGSVTYSAPNVTLPFQIGNGAGQLEIYTSETTSGGTGVGNISLTSGGGLSINPTWLVTNSVNDPLASTNITLNATGAGASSGAVLVSSGSASTGWSNSLLGPTGALNITTNSPTNFAILGTSVPSNGIYTSTPIVGGSITITNNGGGITLGLANGLQAQASGGTVSLTAATSILQSTVSQTISAPTITLNATTGTVGTSALPIVIGTPAMATASSVNLTSPSGIYVTDTSAGFSTPQTTGPNINTLTLVASAPIVSFTANNANAPLVLLPDGLVNSSTVTINAFGSTSSQGIETVMNIGNQTGVVTLNAGTGTITENPTYAINMYPPIYIEGTTVALTANSVLSTNPTNTNFLVTENALTYNGTMTNNELIVNNNYFPTTLNAGTTTNFNYQTDGTLTITGAQTTSGNYNVTSWGNLFVNAPINSTGTVDLKTVSGGAISSANNSVVTAPTVNLLSDYGNLTVNVNAANLNLGTTGVVNLANSANNSTLTTPAGTTFTAFTLLSSGTGNLTIDANLFTSNGSILLEATNTATGSITVDSGLVMHASSTQPNLGSVTITIGAPPTTPVVGTVPNNVLISNTLGGTTYFGSTANPSGTITAQPPDSTLNASGRNIIFNSDGRPSAITLDGNDAITADPPVLGASPLTVVSPAVTATIPAVGASPNFITTTSPTVVTNTTSASLPPAASIPTQSLASYSSSPVNPNTSVLSSFNTTGLVHSDLSNGVSLSIPALPSANGTVYSINPLSSASSSGLVNAASASIPGVSAGTQATSASGATTGVNSLNNANALTGDNTLVGGVSVKRHGHDLEGATAISDTRKSLDSGAMILCPEHDVTVDSPFGKVQVAAKSLVVLVATNNGLSVFNLHDESRNSVMITAEGKTTDVYPGRHVTISNAKEDKFEDINPGLFIPHRNMRVYDAGSKKVYTSEFHVQSAIRGIEPLQALLSSPDREKQKMANKVYKTIAVLQVLTGKNGNFELLTPKPITAYNIESKAVYEGAAH